MPEAFKRKSALVVGCGGLGVFVAHTLAADYALTLADDDIVDPSNLPRQWMYEISDIGKRKAEVLAVRVGGVARGAFKADEALAYDVVIECSDNADLKFALGDAAARARVPFIVGGVTGVRGFVLTAMPGGPCLRCVFEAPSEWMRTSCRDAGVLGPLPAVVAEVMAAHVAAAMALAPLPLWSLDFPAAQARSVTWQRDPLCMVCA